MASCPRGLKAKNVTNGVLHSPGTLRCCPVFHLLHLINEQTCLGPGAAIASPRAGYRHFDCAERYRNEREVGEALRIGLAAGGIAREGIFVTTKLWKSNRRPERVEPAFEASLERLGLDYPDLYLIHTPCAFRCIPRSTQ
ncbi:aldo/keto reductase [Paraburkholderia sp. GAS348]|uniref:aldo/keto reductase n=1 Tax=Paraburkholderia sp. GAS348 TaxID=3035132 RepID=UPI003D215D04